MLDDLGKPGTNWSRIVLIYTGALGIALGVIFGLNGCKPLTPPPVVVQPDDTESCASACAHLRSLGCPEGDDLADGSSCVKFCVDTQVSGHALAPSCVVTIQTCEELNTKCSQPRDLQR